MSLAVSRCEELVGRRYTPSSATKDEAVASLWGRGVPRRAKLTSGRLAVGSGFVAELGRCPGIGRCSAQPGRSIVSRWNASETFWTGS